MKSDANGSRILPLLILLLAGSGCAALIYEIVWFQLLQLVIGSSAISLGLLLAAYMGGLCLGSALLPRIVPQGLHPLRVYGVIESGIGILGLIVLFAVPLVGRMYVAAAAQGLIGLVVRGAIAAVCLLPPTVLMGASLPAIARWVRTTPKGLSWVGFLYSGNIAGAVFGCLLAGFYLLRVYDMAVATYAAAAVNLLVAAISFVAAARFPRATEHGVDEESRLLDARRSTRRCAADLEHGFALLAQITGQAGAVAAGALDRPGPLARRHLQGEAKGFPIARDRPRRSPSSPQQHPQAPSPPPGRAHRDGYRHRSRSPAHLQASDSILRLHSQGPVVPV